MSSEPPNEVKAPLMMSGGSEDEWRIHLYNQERMISSQDRLNDMIDKLLENQKRMASLADHLTMELEVLAKVMDDSTKATKGMITNIIKVPIVIVIMGLSSMAFYFKYIEEHTWLAITAVAVFPYLGDSITAIAKIFGLGKGNSK